MIKALQKLLVFAWNLTLFVLSKVEPGSWNFFSKLQILEIGVQIFLEYFWSGPAWPCENSDWVAGGFGVSDSRHDVFDTSKQLEILFVNTSLTILLKLQSLSVVYLFNVRAIAELFVLTFYRG